MVLEDGKTCISGESTCIAGGEISHAKAKHWRELSETCEIREGV